MHKIKIVGAKVTDNGNSIEIKLSGAPKDYKYIFLDADDLPDIADMSENL